MKIRLWLVKWGDDMYSLLIVDDEYQVRSGLRDLFDWQGLGIQVAADACDGVEALPLLERLKPDILLTDVRMNRMDGIELARRARRLLPGIAIVFISGYSDADYLKNALHVEAADYIYKPVRMAELRRTLERLVKRLDERRRQQTQQERYRELLEKSKPLLVERFLRSWFHGLMEDEQSIRGKMELMGLHFPEGSGVAAAVFQPLWTSLPDDGQAESGQMLLESAIRQSLRNVLTCAEDTGVVALLSVGEEGQMAQACQALEAIGRASREALGTSLLIGTSAWHASWLDAPAAVREARQTVAHQVFPTDETVLRYAPEELAERPAYDALEGDLLERLLLSGREEALLDYLEDALRQQKGSPNATRKMLMCMALRADLALEKQGMAGLDSLAFCRHAMGYMPVTAVKSSLISRLKRACAAAEKQREQGYSPVVAHVMEIIHTRYGERLSVGGIAEEVHYSAAHLSTLFRRETGITLSDALLHTRLRAAMDLLRTTWEPVSAIAGKAGYADVQYFSRVFKQFTGCTPLEWRRKALA